MSARIGDSTAAVVEVLLVRAPNPGTMTFEGTNTWVVRGPAGTFIIDPGPADADHVAVLAVFDHEDAFFSQSALLRFPVATPVGRLWAAPNR